MQINWVIVRIFGVLVVLLHLVVAALLLFALYAKSDPETAARIVQSIEWYRLLNPSFEMILAIIFLVYVILVGSLSVLLNISKRMDESVSVLGEIRDLLKDQNGGQKSVSLNKDLGNWPPSVLGKNKPSFRQTTITCFLSHAP